MSWAGTIFGGQNPTLSGAIPKAGQASGFATGQGEGLLTQAGGWLKGLLSGDASKQQALLAPQIGAAKTRAQQGKQTMAQFGTRGGGTGAASAAMDTATRGDITSAVAGLTGNAISTGMSEGKSLLDAGMSFLDKQVNFSQQQVENWSNSILGQATATGVGGLEKAALGLIPGA